MVCADVRLASMWGLAVASALLVSAVGEALGGDDRPSARVVWVYFADKGDMAPAVREAALAELGASYPARALERRRLRRSAPGLVDERDLPVPTAHIDAVSAMGVRIRVVSRWLNAVSVELDATADEQQQIALLRSLPRVVRIEPVGVRIRSTPAFRHDRASGADGHHGLATEQLDQIGIVPLHDMGFTGDGIIIGILDTGFKRTHLAFNHPANPLHVIAEYDFVDDDPTTSPQPGDHPDQHVHGTLILGALAAYLPGELVGAAPGASYILCKTEDITQEVPQEEDFYVAGLEFIEFHGGDIATSSLGYIDWYTQSQLNGATAVTTIAVNIATQNGVVCVTAAGNRGHDANPMTSNLIAPADAFDVITVGAVSSEGSTVGFSSDGPTADGRIKPELMARGARTWTVDAGDDAGFSNPSGTSMATPLIAGAAACLLSARPHWDIARLRGLMFNAASEQRQHGRPDPLFVRGYGIADAASSLADDCYADCDGSSGRGVLDIFDFLCFGNAFESGSRFACDCDVVSGPAVCDVFDFLCFGNAFNAGCD